MSFKERFENWDKWPRLCLVVIILVTVVVSAGLFYFLSKDIEMNIQELPKNTMKETIRSLTAPNLGESISEEVQESLLAPSDSEVLENKEEILKSLSAPK